MKVYPRLVLDISFYDLLVAVLSFLVPIERARITHQIQAFWGIDREVLVTLSVRTSLDLFLQALDLPHGSEILMSAVNITHMVEIVERHHYIPVVVDIDLETLAPSLELLQASITSKSRVFVIAHLFGTVTPLEAYLEVCRAHNILLVEDCAQAFAGLRYLGDSNADISLFSFGPIKSCTALGGAVMLVRDKALAKSIQAIEQTYPSKSEGWFFVRLCKYLGLKFLSIPEIFGLLIGCLQRFQKDPDSLINSLTRGFPKGDILAQLRYRPPNRMLGLLQNRLQHLDSSHFDKREHYAREFLSLLGDRIFPLGSKAAQHSYWLVPIMIDDPVLLMAKIRAEGFDPTRGTTSLRSIGEASIQAKQLIENVLYLPIHPTLSEVQLLHLAQIINSHPSDPKE
ncbi:aminotransferase class V-fold PLP-dependent enzyme [Tumidithrix helvetica]|uniref:aminotransferase class V-fold PLP-dependent enzyme n=1 Tax=Tumidithrix helvetica TaxID=3457545 RepID=UPI003CC6CA39